MAERHHAIEIVKAYDGDKVLATIWWDGQEVQSDNKAFLDDLKENDMIRAPISDGARWINEVAQMHKNGYLHARRAK